MGEVSQINDNKRIMTFVVLDALLLLELDDDDDDDDDANISSSIESSLMVSSSRPAFATWTSLSECFGPQDSIRAIKYAKQTATLLTTL